MKPLTLSRLIETLYTVDGATHHEKLDAVVRIEVRWLRDVARALRELLSVRQEEAAAKRREAARRGARTAKAPKHTDPDPESAEAERAAEGGAT